MSTLQQIALKSFPGVPLFFSESTEPERSLSMTGPVIELLERPTTVVG